MSGKNSTVRGSANGRPYGLHARDYAEAGFAPIPANGKRTKRDGHHGRGKPWVTDEEIADWSAQFAAANIAARLPRDVVGLDIDAYDGKPGAETLAQLEDELGPLDPTVISTSRDDGVSGIRLFRIPERYRNVMWPGKAGPGIDIIWHGNRYVMAWPSVHPDTGAVYEWWQETPDRDEWLPLDGVPDLDGLPQLPSDWCDYFAQPASNGSGRTDVGDVRAWLLEYGSGRMCDQMAADVERCLGEIPGGAHEAVRDGVLAVVKDAADGHTGMWEARGKIRVAFMHEMTSRGRRRLAVAQVEWESMVAGAVEIAAGLLNGSERPAADPCLETADASEFRPIRGTDNILWAGDVTETTLSWLQKPLLPFGSLVIIDGDPGQGKSTITDTMVANAVNGQPLLPHGEHCGRLIKCGLIGFEDAIDSVVMGRLRAAGYEKERHGRMVAFLRLKKQRGKTAVLTFPDGVDKVRSFIVNGGLEFLVIDPITSFLGEDIKSHVDASVRAALGPLAEVAQETGCCIVLVRHLNKQGQMKAIYRGGGSIAFSAIARSGLITGELPDGRYGLAQVKCSNAERFKGALAYSVVGWEDDTSIPVIEWYGEADATADDLVRGPRPEPERPIQDQVEEVLSTLFAERDTWPQQHVMAELKAAGCTTNVKTVARVRKRMGIESKRVLRRGNFGVAKWVWTAAPAKPKLSENGRENDARA